MYLFFDNGFSCVQVGSRENIVTPLPGVKEEEGRAEHAPREGRLDYALKDAAGEGRKEYLAGEGNGEYLNELGKEYPKGEQAEEYLKDDLGRADLLIVDRYEEPDFVFYPNKSGGSTQRYFLHKYRTCKKTNSLIIPNKTGASL